jgi:hypothetical protein
MANMKIKRGMQSLIGSKGFHFLKTAIQYFQFPRFGKRVRGLGTILKAVLFQIVVDLRSRNFGKCWQNGCGYSSATRLAILQMIHFRDRSFFEHGKSRLPISRFLAKGFGVFVSFGKPYCFKLWSISALEILAKRARILERHASGIFCKWSIFGTICGKLFFLSAPEIWGNPKP